MNPSHDAPHTSRPFGDDRNPYRPPEADLLPSARTDLGLIDASRWTRFAGALVDGFLSFIAMVPGFVVIIADRDDVWTFMGIVLIVAGAFALSVVQWYLIATTGQSLAKRWMRMKIVKVDGADVNFVSGVVLRAWVIGAAGMIPYLGNLIGLLDALFIFGADRRCLHDHIAGTRVVMNMDL